MSRETLLYSPKPVFGIDIGHGTVKILQASLTPNGADIIGYGSTTFDQSAIHNGQIKDFEAIAKAMKELFVNGLVGSITTNKVAACLPVSQTFNRVISLPKLDKKDLVDAVKLEAEQYIPIPIDQLYLDYQIVDTKEDSVEVMLSATQKDVVNSYVKLFDILGLETSIIEPSILSVSRLITYSESAEIPTLIVDLGSATTDLIIYDKTVRVTGSVNFGGEIVTEKIANALDINPRQAQIIKTKYGIDKSKKDAVIMESLSEPIALLISEIKKIIRFYEDRDVTQGASSKKVEQVIILGGSANLPGLNSYLTNALRIPTRLCDPWKKFSFYSLKTPHQTENAMYATVAGLALIDPREITA